MAWYAICSLPLPIRGSKNISYLSLLFYLRDTAAARTPLVDRSFSIPRLAAMGKLRKNI